MENHAKKIFCSIAIINILNLLLHPSYAGGADYDGDQGSLEAKHQQFIKLARELPYFDESLPEHIFNSSLPVARFEEKESLSFMTLAKEAVKGAYNGIRSAFRHPFNTFVFALGTQVAINSALNNNKTSDKNFLGVDNESYALFLYFQVHPEFQRNPPSRLENEKLSPPWQRNSDVGKTYGRTISSDGVVNTFEIKSSSPQKPKQPRLQKKSKLVV